MRFAAIYQGRWTSAIQDPRMLELTKFEWHGTLKKFDSDIIMETVDAIKEKPFRDDRDNFPSIIEFNSIATAKTKLRNEKKKMEEKERENAAQKLLGPTLESDAAKEAREAIRRLCRIKVTGDRTKADR